MINALEYEDEECEADLDAIHKRAIERFFPHSLWRHTEKLHFIPHVELPGSIDEWVPSHTRTERILILDTEPAELRGQLFHDLKRRWKRETSAMSSVEQIAMSPSYQRIIGLGMPIVPLILRDLRKEPAHWFWALSAITGENPVPEDEEGDIRQMSQRWIAWGHEKGLI